MNNALKFFFSVLIGVLISVLLFGYGPSGLLFFSHQPVVASPALDLECVYTLDQKSKAESGSMFALVWRVSCESKGTDNPFTNESDYVYISASDPTENIRDRLPEGQLIAMTGTRPMVYWRDKILFVKSNYVTQKLDRAGSVSIRFEDDGQHAR